MPRAHSCTSGQTPYEKEAGTERSLRLLLLSADVERLRESNSQVTLSVAERRAEQLDDVE